MKIFLVFYALMTIVTFILYGVDKGKAKKGRWRIPEKTLLLFAACFGGLGAFKILVPTFMIIQFILIAAGVYFLYIRH